MPVKIRVGNIQGAALASRVLRKAMERVITDWARRTVRLQKASFTAGGHQIHGGKRWAPLAESTRRQKRRLGHPTALVRTGAMRSSVGVRFAFGQRLRTLFVVTDRKARWHQFGTRRMPARPIAVVTRDDRKVLKRRVVVVMRDLLQTRRRL